MSTITTDILRKMQTETLIYLGSEALIKAAESSPEQVDYIRDQRLIALRCVLILHEREEL